MRPDHSRWRFSAEPSGARLITAAGVSAGVDMALQLVELLVDDVAAQAAQVFIEYDPQPPFDAGHPSKVTPSVLERVREYAQLRD